MSDTKQTQTLFILGFIFLVLLTFILFSYANFNAFMYGNTLRGSQVDQLCDVNDTLLQKVNGTWQCSELGYTGTCSTSLIVDKGVVTGCV